MCKPAAMSCSQADVNAVTSSKSTALWHAVGSSVPYGPVEIGVPLVPCSGQQSQCAPWFAGVDSLTTGHGDIGFERMLYR